MFGPVKPPSACRKVIQDIEQRAKQWNSKYEAKEITTDCKFHFFILKDYLLPGVPKPDPAAYGYDGLSVRVAGGNFGEMNKAELCRELIAFREMTKRDYVGVVYWNADQIMDKNLDELKFAIEHDPFPELKNEEWREQGPRHAQIICEKKRTTKREILNDLADWSLTPKEFEIISRLLFLQPFILGTMAVAFFLWLLKGRFR